jgi:hypothetical protein
MELQYRIAAYGTDYYPQVRIKGLLCWGGWKKIAVHPSGYGLYDLPNREYPKDKEECEVIIRGFDKWYREQKQKQVRHIPFTP